MPAKRRYVGWRVLWMTLADRIDTPHCWASCSQSARKIVERMNRLHPGRLYWCEYWNTDSFLNCDDGPDHDEGTGGGDLQDAERDLAPSAATTEENDCADD